jgi:hypothetical protein
MTTKAALATAPFLRSWSGSNIAGSNQQSWLHHPSFLIQAEVKCLL